jgi:hypothetical protein
MIIWSDIILANNFNIKETKNGCQVGIANIPGRWSLKHGKLLNVYTGGPSVAGVWIFSNKLWLDDIPDTGSFTKWLQAKNIPLFPISLKNSLDIGTIESYKAINNKAIRSRPYNKIEIIGNRVRKTALTQDAIKLI